MHKIMLRCTIYTENITDILSWILGEKHHFKHQGDICICIDITMQTDFFYTNPHSFVM